MSNSPWAWKVESKSPNGEHIASISKAVEIAMGAPTSGVLNIDSSIQIESCNPSIIWSDDSKYLAVPQWTRERNQKLLIINVTTGEVVTLKHDYRVLELHSFSDGLLKGVDSPIHKPKNINIKVHSK